MTTVVQIAPEIGPGSGVAAVAHHLEEQLRARGIATRRFTMADAYGSWLPEPGPGISGKAAIAARVVWFSTVGTVLARRSLRRQPDVVAICHNDAVAGDVYVNHGIVLAAMQARGRPLLRMVRNPLHVFTWARDTARFASRAHRLVVNLTTDEDVLLRRSYGRVRPPTAVIGNGVDTAGLCPPTDAERRAARAGLGFTDDDVVLLFVGHEFDRKGLPVLVDALAAAPEAVRLLVVGGTVDMVENTCRYAEAAGVGDRVRLVGRLADPSAAFQAADVFGLPSAYESFGLVVLEALAYGVPVIATPVGVVPDVIDDGRNGYVVTDARDVSARLADFVASDRAAMSQAARESAERFSWPQVADRYVQLLERLGARFDSSTVATAASSDLAAS